MARKIKNPIEVRACIHIGDGSGQNLHWASIRYTLSCEHNIEERKELFLIHNPEVEHFVKDFVEEGLEQVDIHEGIAEEDSMLEYPRPS